MDLKNIPVRYQPAYTWLWNTTITRDGIKARIDEMYDAGIRAFYVIGEPENFRPNVRRTHLSPKYLSAEYIDHVYYAYETAKEKGMYTWLYNEGGFPSGSVCGEIRRKHPELSMKLINKREISLLSGKCYIPSEDAIAAFFENRRIVENESFRDDVTLTEYFFCDNERSPLLSDNASRENCRLFINMTHEKLKERFSSAMGCDIKLMFDDEASMGSWTEGLDEIFKEKYGYEIGDFIPFIFGDREPETQDEYRAVSDYFMLCGELIRENYFIPMKEWLNKNGMLSTGHLDNDHRPDGIVINRYGNSMKTLRAFDVPGIDVIWNQIYYPDENNSFDGMRFFPRFASSAARQLGHSDAMSESFAVYGAHVDGELMRFGVNYQAVRGISLFNFMVMSYDKDTAMLHQFRPNFVKENPSMDTLHKINEYTARLSYLLSATRADISTALYFPARSISARGEAGRRAMESFVKLGEELEERGISFDIIDEDLVREARAYDGKLNSEKVSYSEVYLPEGELEPSEVISKLSDIKGEAVPFIERKCGFIQSRKLRFDNGDEGYFIVNTWGERVCEKIKINTSLPLYRLSLEDGVIYKLGYTQSEDSSYVDIDLLRGEGVMILASERDIDATELLTDGEPFGITEFSSFISRKLEISTERGTVNTYFDDGERKSGLYLWDKDLSGEVTYDAVMPKLPHGEYILSLGELSSSAKVYVDGKFIGESEYPPHNIRFKADGNEKSLRITVANTAANECARTDYFDRTDIRDVGPYHEKMKGLEKKMGCGGLFGPVTLQRIVLKGKENGV